MKLSLEDKKILSELGCPETDFPQIEAAMQRGMTMYSDGTAKLGLYQQMMGPRIYHSISQKRTIDLLGKRRYLAGLSRSAFHSSAVQCT